MNKNYYQRNRGSAYSASHSAFNVPSIHEFSNRRIKKSQIYSRQSTNNISQIYTCPSCNKYFDCTITANNSYTGRLPLVLHCSHTLCQECISKLLTNKVLKCPVCQKESVLDALPNNLQESFQPNFYLLGVILYSKSNGPNVKDRIGFVSVKTRKKNKENQSQTVQENYLPVEKCCFGACNQEAKLRCLECNDNYCTNCCLKVHNSTENVRSHTQLDINKSEFTANLAICAKHNMALEFNCNTCGTSGCDYCMLKFHLSHDIKAVSELDNSEIEEVETLRVNAEKMLKQIVATQKKLQSISGYSTNSAEHKISTYFYNLHSKIQKTEQKLRNDLNNIAKNKDFQNMSSALIANSKLVKDLIVASGDIGHNRKINARYILEKLREVKDLPSFLLNESATSEPIKFISSPILDNIEDQISLNYNANSNYVLVPEKDLPIDYFSISDLVENENASCSDSSSLYSNSSLQIASSSKNISTSSPVIFNRVSHNNFENVLSTSRQSVSMSDTDLEKVVVTEISSIECFYIQYKNLQHSLKQLEDDVGTYVKMGAPQLIQPCLENLCLVRFHDKLGHRWCRGRVIEILNEDNLKLYKIFVIDHGCTQTVELNRLRVITPSLTQKTPFVVKCSLHNPKNIVWNKSAVNAFRKIIVDKELYMVKIYDSGDLHVVDLLIESSDGGYTSIVDILTARCSKNEYNNDSKDDYLEKNTIQQQFRIFPNSKKLTKNQSEDVIVANVVDPDNVFVQIAGHGSTFKSLITAMKKAYKTSATDICDPVEGNYVAVKHKDPIRGLWHRALVTKVNVNIRKVHVLLVDWGINITTDISNVRGLQKKFIKLESQAILVKMVHVAPYNKCVTWSKPAIEYLQTYFKSQKILKMVVHSVEPQLEVAFFESSDSFDICLNAKLAQDHLADSTGHISTIVEWLAGNVDGTDESEDVFVTSLLRKIDMNETSDEDDDMKLVKREIEIVKAEDPDAIYVKFVANEKNELALCKELQIHYSQEQVTKEMWQPGEMCVVLYTEQYHRGKIVEHVDDNSYKIYLPDMAQETVIPRNKIYIYEKYFGKYPQLTIKCHLANIKPAGDTGSWSFSAIEALQKMFEINNKFYLAKINEGSCSKKSMPVQIWYGKVKLGGALEPNKTVLKSISNVLTSLGFAFKIKPNMEIVMADEGEELQDSAQTKTQIKKSIKIDKKEPEAFKDAKLEKAAEYLDTISQNNEILTIPIPEQAQLNSWFVPVNLTEREFTAVVTCAETGGYLFLHDEKLEPVYKHMEEKMKEYFDKNKPIKKNNTWEVGNLCTIYYEENWYRGIILKIKSPSLLTVFMIDFGSDHDVTPDVLFKEVFYLDIEAFAKKVKLDKVYSKSGSWLSSDYDALMNIVTEKCRVVVIGPMDVEVPCVDVYTDAGVNINQKLTEMCPNLTRSLVPMEVEDEAVVIEEDPNAKSKEILNFYKDFEIEWVDSSQSYLEPCLPSDKTSLKSMTVMNVFDYNKIVLKDVNRQASDQAYQLMQDIIDSVESLPTIENIKVGTLCVAPYSVDGQWYRARVHSIDGLEDGFVIVLFVDYGNTELVSLKTLKMLKKDWTKVPIECYIVNINIELKHEKHHKSVEQHINRLLGNEVLVQIVDRGLSLVDLYEQNQKLCYETIINHGLVKKVVG